jgi:hypothetical protein
LFARDGVTADPLPRQFVLTDGAWVLLFVSVFFYFRKPLITLLAAWICFAVFAVSLERFADEHSVVWFLWRHSLLLGFLAAAHVGYLLKRPSGKRVAPNLFNAE